MASYTNCKVGNVQSVIGRDDRSSYGFGVVSDRDKPVVHFAFETEADAKQARDEIAKVVAKAVEITPLG